MASFLYLNKTCPHGRFFRCDWFTFQKIWASPVNTVRQGIGQGVEERSKVHVLDRDCGRNRCTHRYKAQKSPYARIEQPMHTAV